MQHRLIQYASHNTLQNSAIKKIVLHDEKKQILGLCRYTTVEVTQCFQNFKITLKLQSQLEVMAYMDDTSYKNKIKDSLKFETLGVAHASCFLAVELYS